jgi:hypothetical protein
MTNLMIIFLLYSIKFLKCYMLLRIVQINYLSDRLGKKWEKKIKILIKNSQI